MSAADLFLLSLGAILPSAVISWAVVWIVRRNAVSWRLIDLPNARKVHATPTPRGGGIGILVGVLLTFAIGTIAIFLISQGEKPALLGFELPAFASKHLSGIKSQLPSLWTLLGCGTILGLLGLADDRGGVDWRIRLLVEFAVAAFCVFWEGWRLTAFLPIPFLADILSVLWIVALINSFNMLDNMDALSGGVAAISASTLGAVMLLTPEGAAGPQLFVAGFLFVLVGGILGFLWHNRPPAKIFMGDCGAYFIGFCIAVATMLATFVGTTGSPKPHSILAPLFVLAIPLYDLVSVLAIRLRAGASPFEADKNHFSHRLVDLGMSKPQAVCTIYLICLTFSFAAILLHRTDSLGAILLAALVACILAIIAILEFVARHKQNGKAK